MCFYYVANLPFYRLLLRPYLTRRSCVNLIPFDPWAFSVHPLLFAVLKPFFLPSRKRELALFELFQCGKSPRSLLWNRGHSRGKELIKRYFQFLRVIGREVATARERISSSVLFAFQFTFSDFLRFRSFWFLVVCAEILKINLWLSIIIFFPAIPERKFKPFF